MYLEECVDRIEIIEVGNGFMVRSEDKLTICTTIAEVIEMLLDRYPPDSQESITFKLEYGGWREQ